MGDGGVKIVGTVDGGDGGDGADTLDVGGVLRQFDGVRCRAGANLQDDGDLSGDLVGDNLGDIHTLGHRHRLALSRAAADEESPRAGVEQGA